MSLTRHEVVQWAEVHAKTLTSQAVDQCNRRDAHALRGEDQRAAAYQESATLFAFEARRFEFVVRALRDADTAPQEPMTDRPTPSALALLERLARQQHARLTFEDRDKVPEAQRHAGGFDDCQGADCVQARAILEKPHAQ